ncbi:putative LPS assembly protein LptD [Polaribacter sp.]|nr:putative LPS assembly protein LptD [Polaribacter sp.]
MQSNLTYILLLTCLFICKISFSEEKNPKKRWLQLYQKDSTIIKNTDSLPIQVTDSTKSDSIKKPKESIEDIITHTAKGYTIQNAKEKTVTLYDEAHVVYTDIDLTAGEILINYITNTVRARGIKDSTGTGYVQRPIFIQGGEQSEQDSIIFNFKTERAIIYGLKTKQGEMFTYGTKTKRVNDSTIYVRKIRFTTSEKENPDYYIGTDKAKLVPGKKIIVGASNLVLADVPTPIILPFAYFPLTQTRTSGFLIPAFDPGNSSRGIGMQNGGYYLALNEYFDLTVLGDLYSNGSWGTRVSSKYKVRYKFSGNFTFSYENNVSGIRGFDDFSKSTNYNINWTHRQDTKSSPNSSFSASVRLGSSQFYRQTLNQISVAQSQTNSFNSSINYSKNFIGTPFNMSLTATHQQNTNTENIQMTLPSWNINMDRIFPFVGKDGVQKTPIEKMGFNYTMQGQYLVTTNDDDFLTPAMFNDTQAGMQHRTGTSTNLKVMKFFTLSPSINYEETWHFDYINKFYDPVEDEVVTENNTGFRSYREYNTGASLSTNIYGTFPINKGRLKAIRHTMRPSISYTYRPDFADAYTRSVQQSVDPLDLDEYTIFDDGLYGGPSSGLSNSIGISVNNVLEAKVAPKDPDSDEEDEKVSILNNLNFSTSYNMAADSLKWSPVSFSAGTRLLKDKLAVNLSGSFDPYTVNESGTRINEYTDGFLRLTNASLTANYSLSSKDFQKQDGKKQEQNGNQDVGDILGSDINPTDRFNNGTINGGPPQNGEETEKTTKLYAADIPWSVTIAYSSTFADDGLTGLQVGNHSLMFSGNLELTPKWKLGYSSGYDILNGGFTFSRLNFTRDLDSWQFNFNWVPFGTQTSYTFFIGVKSSLLSDLKWDKNKPADRTF